VPLWQPASVVFLNACANVHCVNACVCFEANKYSSSSLRPLRTYPDSGRGKGVVMSVWTSAEDKWTTARLNYWTDTDRLQVDSQLILTVRNNGTF